MSCGAVTPAGVVYYDQWTLRAPIPCTHNEAGKFSRSLPIAKIVSAPFVAVSWTSPSPCHLEVKGVYRYVTVVMEAGLVGSRSDNQSAALLNYAHLSIKGTQWLGLRTQFHFAGSRWPAAKSSASGGVGAGIAAVEVKFAIWLPTRLFTSIFGGVKTKELLTGVTE